MLKNILNKLIKNKKKKVYIHGNCQSAFYAKILMETDRFEVKYGEAHRMDLNSDLSIYEENIRNADIVIAQDVTNNFPNTPSFKVDWIKDNCRGRVILIPRLYFNSFFPHLQYLRGHNVAEMPYHDANILNFFLAGLDEKETYKRISSSNFYTSAFLESEFASDMDALAKREKGLGIDDYISSRLMPMLKSTKQPLFTQNHPRRLVGIKVLEHILSKHEIECSLTESGPEYLRAMIFPIYPSTTKVFGSESMHNNLAVSYKNKIIPISEYLSKCYIDYHNIGQENLILAVKRSPKLLNYYRRYESYHGAMPYEFSKFR